MHLGKHGTLEWLPGKGLGLSAACAPDAVLGDLPLVYPFIVNDPGRGHPGQAARRTPRSSTTWSRRWPAPTPTATWPSSSSCSTSTRRCSALDPAKLPARAGADLGADPGRRAAPRPAPRRAARRDRVRRFVLHVDGYLCEIKDVQIRDGLHVLGCAPAGRAAGRHGARRAARHPDLGRARRAAGPARRARHRVRAGREALLADPGRAPTPSPAAAWRGDGRWPARPAGPRTCVDLIETLAPRACCRRAGRPRAGTPEKARAGGRRGARRGTADRGGRCWSSPPARSCPGWPAPPTR